MKLQTRMNEEMEAVYGIVYCSSCSNLVLTGAMPLTINGAQLVQLHYILVKKIH